MAFEIVPSPHLPPNRCAACGCTEAGPYVFIPHNAAWENGWPFICKKCVEEMSRALGITRETIEVEVVKEVEVVRDPTDAELLAFVASRFTLLKHGEPIPIYDQLPAEPPQNAANQGDLDETMPDEPKAVCVCGAEFTGPTAKAKLGSHKRNCQAVKGVGAHG